MRGEAFEPLSLHKYLYAHANPIGRIDPSGNMSLVEGLTATFTAVNVASKMFVAYQVGHLIGNGIRFTYDEELQTEQLVDEALKTGLSIGGGWAFGKAAGLAFGKWIGPLARKLTPLRWQRAQQLGAAAEAHVFAKLSVFKNSKTLSELGGKGSHIPDAITSTTLHEVKNVARLPWDSQLSAFAKFADQTKRKFVIYVREGAKIDGTVIKNLEGQFGRLSRGTKWDI